MASRRTRIERGKRGMQALYDYRNVGYDVTDESPQLSESAIVAAVVDAAGCPDLMGAKEVAAELGTSVPNLRVVSGLPEPVAEVAATRLWDADEIRRFARERKRKAVGAGGLAPHREHRKRRG